MSYSLYIALFPPKDCHFFIDETIQIPQCPVTSIIQTMNPKSYALCLVSFMCTFIGMTVSYSTIAPYLQTSYKSKEKMNHFGESFL